MNAALELMRSDLVAGRTITATDYPDLAAFHGAMVLLLDELPIIESWRTSWESRANGFRLRQRVYRLPAGMTRLNRVVGKAFADASPADSMTKAHNQGLSDAS